MKTHLLTACLALSLRAMWAGDSAPLDVAVTPSAITLPADEEWAAVKYRFTNPTPQPCEIVARSAFFHSLANDWQSDVIGPIPMNLKLPAGAPTEWPDQVLVSRSLIEEAMAEDGLSDGELILVQQFTLVSPGGKKRHLATSLIVHVDARPPATEPLERRHFAVTVRSSLLADHAKNQQLTKLLDFADAAYESLSTVLGYSPGAGARVPLRIVWSGGSPYYQPDDGGYINIPCDVVEAQDSDWLWVAFPHELTHYFLLQEFPDPPRWFIEGPASFFGNKVSTALGYEKTAEADRRKILGWITPAKNAGPGYLFKADWPEPKHTEASAATGSNGMALAYRMCMKIEELCDPDIFTKTFAHMRANHLSFTSAKNEKERTEILIGALQTQTGRDIWALFAREGFRP